MKRKNPLPIPLRVIGCILAVTQIFIGTPVRVCAEAVAPSPIASLAHAQPRAVTKRVKNIPVNRTVPETTVPSEFPQFSSEPTDAEISRARVFEEPLIPTSQESNKAENLALSTAISAYLHRGSNDDVSAITQFLSAYPMSKWRASILLNLGIVYRWTGYFSKGLESWNEAWNLLKNENEPRAKALGDRVAQRAIK